MAATGWLDLIEDVMVQIRAETGPLERAILAMTCRYESAARPPPLRLFDWKRRAWITYVQRIAAAEGLVDLCVSLFRPLDAAVDGCPGCPRKPRLRYYEVLLPMIVKRGKLEKWRAICCDPRVRAILGFYVDQVQRILVRISRTNGARAMEEVLGICAMHVPTALTVPRVRLRKRRNGRCITVTTYVSYASHQ
jgi:hypothetical protein